MKASKPTAEPMLMRARRRFKTIVAPIAQRGREVRWSTWWVFVS